jgi:hypothetical protein
MPTTEEKIIAAILTAGLLQKQELDVPGRSPAASPEYAVSLYAEVLAKMAKMPPAL